ncbi:MAG: hypothetical protein U5L00_16035 [Desulfovermiculus sp.]|nr:hypothetical protein [Desulfovermiculus sp.]
MKQIDMSPTKVSQRLRYVAQLRRMCLKLSAAGRKNELNLREQDFKNQESHPASDPEGSIQNAKHTCHTKQ